MSRLTPWNHHPRACVIPSTEYDITNESDRVKASMAGILANVWIFNARTVARKWAPMGVWQETTKVKFGSHLHRGQVHYGFTRLPGHVNARCVATQICCHKCGALNVGLLDGLCFGCRP